MDVAIIIHNVAVVFLFIILVLCCILTAFNAKYYYTLAGDSTDPNQGKYVYLYRLNISAAAFLGVAALGILMSGILSFMTRYKGMIAPISGDIMASTSSPQQLAQTS